MLVAHCASITKKIAAVAGAGSDAPRTESGGSHSGPLGPALAVIMHRIWVTGDQFDFVGPAVAAKAT
jgi:hypothetical protein